MDWKIEKRILAANGVQSRCDVLERYNYVQRPIERYPILFPPAIVKKLSKKSQGVYVKVAGLQSVGQYLDFETGFLKFDDVLLCALDNQPGLSTSSTHYRLQESPEEFLLTVESQKLSGATRRWWSRSAVRSDRSRWPAPIRGVAHERVRSATWRIDTWISVPWTRACVRKPPAVSRPGRIINISRIYKKNWKKKKENCIYNSGNLS